MDEAKLLAQTKPLSLLYVEDDAASREETAEILHYYFDDITIAVDGSDGFRHYSSGQYDLVITDIKMPNMDGIAMIRKIRDENRQLPVIVISSHNETSFFLDTIRLGIDAYLLKPINLTDLVTVLQKVSDKITMERELQAYRDTLEEKISEQVASLNRQNMLMAQQARLASMGEMINNIAHQWRQPLNRINSNVAVINSMLGSGDLDPEILAAKITNVKQNTRYMSDTIEDFANFFHPDKQPGHFNLDDALTKTLKLLESRLQDIEIDRISDGELAIVSYEKEYRQVILAIINNALDNFEVTQTPSPKIEIVTSSDEASATLTICDNGGGIVVEDVSRVFEPYFTTKFAHEGTGLGLYMSKMIVESSMHGTLNVYNRDSGACFEICIPREHGHG